MLRALVVAALSSWSCRGLAAQAPSVLHIKVGLLDAERKVTPVPRHALLISDNPATSPPRRVVTGLDGTVDVRLRPGNYTVESDQPVAFQGKAYQWTQTVDIVAGREAVLELTPPTRRSCPLSSVPAGSATPLDAGGDRPSDAAASMAGQRRGALDADHPRVRIPDRRRERAHGDEPAGRRHGDLRRGAVLAGGQGGGERARGRSGARRRRPLDRSEGCRVGAARAARMRVRGAAARRGRAGDLHHRGAASSGEGHDVRGRQARGDARARCPTSSFPAAVRAARCSRPAAAWSGSPPPGTRSSAQSRWNSRVVRIDDVCDVVASAEKKMKDAAPPGGDASSRGAGAAVSRGRARGRRRSAASAA